MYMEKQCFWERPNPSLYWVWSYSVFIKDKKLFLLETNYNIWQHPFWDFALFLKEERKKCTRFVNVFFFEQLLLLQNKINGWNFSNYIWRFQFYSQRTSLHANPNLNPNPKKTKQIWDNIWDQQTRRRQDLLTRIHRTTAPPPPPPGITYVSSVDPHVRSFVCDLVLLIHGT